MAPALALGIVLQEATDGAMGVPEVLLAEALSNIVFCFVAGSPLLILRVTGEAVEGSRLLILVPVISIFLNTVPWWIKHVLHEKYYCSIRKEREGKKNKKTSKRGRASA